MRDLLDMALYGVPWWVWAIPVPAAALALFLFLSRSFGLRSAIYATGAFLMAFLTAHSFHKGRQRGWEDRVRKDERDAQELVNRIKRARDTANSRNADPERLREDDGFKRKS